MNAHDLPDPTEPFGDPMRPDAHQHVPNYREMQQVHTKIRKTIAELPLPPGQMNTVSVILAYTLVGISPYEIATVIGISEEQVKRIMEGDAFARMRDDIVQTILDQDSNDVRTILAANAKHAARRVVSLVDNDDPTVSLSASKDILDRNGHKANERVSIDVDGQLRIRIVQGDEAPIIDVTPV